MVLLRLDFSVQSWTSLIPVCPLQLGIFPGSVILGLLKFAGYIIPKDLWLPGREHHALVCPMRPTSCPMHRDPEIIPEVQTVRLTSSVDTKNRTEGIKAITSQRKTEFSAGEEFPPRMMSRKLHVYFALDHDEAKPLTSVTACGTQKPSPKCHKRCCGGRGFFPDRRENTGIGKHPARSQDLVKHSWGCWVGQCFRKEPSWTRQAHGGSSCITETALLPMGKQPGIMLGSGFRESHMQALPRV